MAVLPVSGDHQIAHLPPTAASVSAARWSAQFFNIGRTRYFRAGRGSGSGERTVGDSVYGDVQRFGFRGGHGDRFLTYPNRAGSLETCGFKQTFWSLLGLRPKVTRARGRGILPVGDMEEKRTGRRGRRPLQRVRRKCAGIWRCVDAGRRERRPCQGREDIHSAKDTLCAIGTEGVFYLYLCRAVGQRWPLS